VDLQQPRSEAEPENGTTLRLREAMNWNDREAVRGYHLMSKRLARWNRSIRPEATELAKKVMLNEIKRNSNLSEKTTATIKAWQAVYERKTSVTGNKVWQHIVRRQG